MQPVQENDLNTGKPTDKSTLKARRTYGGRRSKPDAERKETVVKVYLDEREDTLLRRLYTEHSFFYGRMSLSDFIKKSCRLDGPESQSRLVTMSTELHLQLIQDVRKLASHLGDMSTNYNQSVKRIKSRPVLKKLNAEIEQFKPFYAELTEQTDDLKQLIVRLTEYCSQLK